MHVIRRMRLQSVIQTEVTLLLSRDLKDPRVPSLTITTVELTENGSQATIFIILSNQGMSADENPTLHKKQIQECLAGLTSASGFLRRHLARILNTRYVPALMFREDRGFENTLRVQTLLQEIAQQQSASTPPPSEHV